MNNNPEMVTNAARLRELFLVRVALYKERMSDAFSEYTWRTSDHSKYHEKMVYIANQEALTAVIACYGDVTNMTFDEARIALHVSLTRLERLS